MMIRSGDENASFIFNRYFVVFYVNSTTGMLMQRFETSLLRFVSASGDFICDAYPRGRPGCGNRCFITLR